jgi:hypothetical protein
MSTKGYTMHMHFAIHCTTVRCAHRYAETGGRGGAACPEWRAFAGQLLQTAATGAAVGSDTVLGRGQARVLATVAASSALGHSAALQLAMPGLTAATDAAAAADARAIAAAAAAAGSSSSSSHDAMSVDDSSINSEHSAAVTSSDTAHTGHSSCSGRSSATDVTAACGAALVAMRMLAEAADADVDYNPAPLAQYADMVSALHRNYYCTTCSGNSRLCSNLSCTSRTACDIR